MKNPMIYNGINITIPRCCSILCTTKVTTLEDKALSHLLRTWTPGGSIACKHHGFFEHNLEHTTCALHKTFFLGGFFRKFRDLSRHQFGVALSHTPRVQYRPLPPKIAIQVKWKKNVSHRYSYLYIYTYIQNWIVHQIKKVQKIKNTCTAFQNLPSPGNLVIYDSPTNSKHLQHWRIPSPRQ